MKNNTLLLIILLVLLPGCSFRQAIEREIKPADLYSTDAGTESTARITEGGIEIAAEVINTGHWKHLLSFDAFRNKKSESSTWRDPGLAFFHIIIKNTGNRPVTADEILLCFGRETNRPVNADAFKKKFQSPAYSLISFKSLFKPRVLYGKKDLLLDIDFDQDTIEYKFNFINSGDTVSRIIAFDPVPVQYRTFNLSLHIKSAERGRHFNFRFNRFEYREKGHFAKPEKEIEKEP